MANLLDGFDTDVLSRLFGQSQQNLPDTQDMQSPQPRLMNQLGAMLFDPRQQNLENTADMQRPTPGPVPGFMEHLQNSMNSPLFHFGMGMMSGRNVAEGFGNARAALAQIADPNGEKALARYLALQHLKLQQQHGGFEERKVALAEKQAVDKPTFGKVGVDSNGNELYGFINAGQEKAKVFNPAGAGAPSSNLTGPDFLDTLDPGRSAQIRAITEGRMQPPGGYALRSPQILGLMRDVGQFEPGFDMTKWTQRYSTAKDFASGKAAGNVTAINTVVGHLGDLMEKVDALHNRDLPMWNKGANAISQFFGNPEVTNFDLARNAVADEMARVFRQVGMSDAETRQWKENLSANMSPQQLRGAIKTGIGLMDSRLQGLADQRARGMDTQLEPRSLLNQKSVDTLNRLESWATGGPAKVAPAKAQSRVPGGPTRYMFNPETGQIE